MLSGGDVFAGRYRVLGRIARGGFGTVYEAEHLTTEERVALKVLSLPQGLASESSVESFKLEARMTARIGSEHIVRVLDAGSDDKAGQLFLVMELLHGATLRGLIEKGGPVSPAQAVVIAQQVAKALDRAHSHVDREGRPAPIVHRDLKPENIFVAMREGAAVVKVLDFGIAKVLRENTEQSQEMRGTPAFMAFEQLSNGPVTPRIDVWAIGLIVFYLLTGRKYWLAFAKGAGDIVSLYGEILTLPLVGATERARALGIEPPWTPDFDDWFFQCVNRDLEARFSTAGAAAAALDAALSPGGRLSKVASAAARSALARSVTSLLGPAAAAPPSAEPAHESTGSSTTDRSAMDVASGEVHSYTPPARTPFGSGPDAPARTPFGSGPDAPARTPFGSRPDAPASTPFGSRPDVPASTPSGSGVDVPAPRPSGGAPVSHAEPRRPLPSFVKTSLGPEPPAGALVPTPASEEPTAPRARWVPPSGPSFSLPAPRHGAPPASALGSGAPLGFAAPAIAPRPQLSTPIKTLPLATAPSHVALNPPVSRPSRKLVLLATIMGVSVGSVALLVVLNLTGSSSAGRTGATSISAPLSAQPVAPAERAAPPDVPANAARPEPPTAELTAPTPAASAQSQERASSEAGGRPETTGPTKPAPREPGPGREGNPRPEKLPKPDAKKTDGPGRADETGPPKKPPQASTETRDALPREAPPAASTPAKSMYDRR